MGPLLNDWILARMMSAPKKDDSVIYKLQNYVCDGTANTAINTGLYLFDSSLYPTGWDIYFDFTVESGNQENASFLRCRNSAQPYNGFTVRRYSNNADSLHIQVNSKQSTIRKYPLSGTRFIITVENPSSSGKYKMLVDGGNALEDSVLSCISPLVIGGELSNDITQTWNNNRFAKITIHSLVITSK